MLFKRKYLSNKDTDKIWKYFYEYKGEIDSLLIWSGRENGRFNKKIYFHDKKTLNKFYKKIPSYIKPFINNFLNFDSTYKSPWGPEEISFLERIQVIESEPSFFENSKGNQVYSFHVDRINTYKKILLCSNISLEDGPFQVANLDSCREYARELLNNIEDLHKNSRNWREFNATIDCNEFVSITGGVGDLLTIDGREPHRAGKVFPGHKRKIIIFEYMTDVNSRRYRETLEK